MSRVATRVFDFTLTLEGAGEFTHDMLDRLFEAGCDDASFGTSDGVASGSFHREAGSLGDAIGSAVNVLQQLGFRVAKVEIDQP